MFCVDNVGQVIEQGSPLLQEMSSSDIINNSNDNVPSHTVKTEAVKHCPENVLQHNESECLYSKDTRHHAHSSTEDCETK